MCEILGLEMQFLYTFTNTVLGASPEYESILLDFCRVSPLLGGVGSFSPSALPQVVLRCPVSSNVPSVEGRDQSFLCSLSQPFQPATCLVMGSFCTQSLCNLDIQSRGYNCHVVHFIKNFVRC